MHSHFLQKNTWIGLMALTGLLTGCAEDGLPADEAPLTEASMQRPQDSSSQPDAIAREESESDSIDGLESALSDTDTVEERQTMDAQTPPSDTEDSLAWDSNGQQPDIRGGDTAVGDARGPDGGEQDVPETDTQEVDSWGTDVQQDVESDTVPEPTLCPQNTAVASNTCVPCEPGTTHPGGDDAAGEDTQCSPCEPGTWDEGDNTCTPCPEGSVSAAGAVECTVCGTGTVAEEGASTCTPCPPGTYEDGTETCASCEPGSVSGEEAESCSPCPPGMYEENNACTPCPQGSVSASQSTACTACDPGTIPSPEVSSCDPCAPGTADFGAGECAPCATDFTSAEGSTQCDLVAPAKGYLSPRDYGFLFWPTNHWFQWNVFFNEHSVQTGYYGLSMDVAAGSFTHLGLFEDELSPEDAVTSDKSMVSSLPTASVTYSVTQNEVEHTATQFLNSEGTANNPSRLINMGRFMQRIDIPQVTYSGTTELAGSIQLAAMPRHFVLSHRATNTSNTGSLTIAIHLDGNAVSQFENVVWLEEDRAVSLTNDAGAGWSFILPGDDGGTSTLTLKDDGGLVFQRHFDTVEAGEQKVLPVVAVPSNAGNEDQLSVWLHPETAIAVQSTQMKLDGSGGENLADATWDPERGLYVIPLKDLSEAGAPGWQNWADETIHNWYNRHRVVVTNNTNSPVSIPLAFEGGNNAAFYVTGGCPLFRDLNQEPLGVPIQISKNWHEEPFWYHLYTSLEVAPGTHEVEHTFAHSKWGTAFAAAHAQLSLIGWGKNQQWDESSMGAFGESITYDPDLTLGRSMVDDVRPFLVQAQNKWSWTGNVGGADFLVYADTSSESFPGHQLGRLRTHYRYTGPNLTEVIYAGQSRDGKIEAHITTHLGRTDDMVRATYRLEYTFLEDTPYDRLALFQMAADRYADNGFTQYAYGNELGVAFDAEIPIHETTGYASENDRGIPLPGDAPWVMLYESTHASGNLPENLANTGFVIRSYEATVGETQYTTPHINITRTFNGGWSQMGFQVGIPYDSSNPVVPAGSVLKATVEYVIPPAVKSTYYGPSDYLTALPEESFQSTDMMMLLAEGNHLEVTPSLGSLIHTYPVKISAEEGTVAAQFTLEGGLGYTPVIITGLARADGWNLEKKVGETWEDLGQAVHGNDYWQAHEAVESNTFELIFNVHNTGATQYRLRR